MTANSSVLARLISPSRHPAVCLLTALATAALAVPSAAATGKVRVSWAANPEADVAGYRVHLGTATRTYTQVLDVGKTTQAELDGLLVGDTYMVNVTAYSNAGLESHFGQEVVFTLEPPPVPTHASDRLILLDAADGQREPAGDLPGGGLVTQDATVLSFTVPVAGRYAVWCRVLVPDAASDSFMVGFDGAAGELYHAYGAPNPPAGAYQNEWTWVRLDYSGGAAKLFGLAEGDHTLRFTPEGGAQLDRMILTSDPNFTPDAAFPRSGDAVAITVHPMSRTVPAGGSTTLTVTAVGTGPLAYQWHKNGAAINGATDPDLPLANFQAADAGSYTVEVTTGVADDLSDPAVVQLVGTVPGLRVASLHRTGPTTLSLQLQGQLGSNLAVYGSDDMRTWRYLGSVRNTNGTVSINDPDAASRPRRFYQLRDAGGK